MTFLLKFKNKIFKIYYTHTLECAHMITHLKSVYKNKYLEKNQSNISATVPLFVKVMEDSVLSVPPN